MALTLSVFYPSHYCVYKTQSGLSFTDMPFRNCETAQSLTYLFALSLMYKAFLLIQGVWNFKAVSWV